MSKRNGHPSWANIRKLRDGLRDMKETEHRRFNMQDFIEILSNPQGKRVFTIGELRKNGPECGSAGCLAGEAVIRLGAANTKLKMAFECAQYIDHRQVAWHAQRILSLTESESAWMFRGYWARYIPKVKPETEEDDCDDNGICLEDIPRGLAVRYLTKVLKEQNIKVVVRMSSAPKNGCRSMYAV